MYVCVDPTNRIILFLDTNVYHIHAQAYELQSMTQNSKPKLPT